GNALGSLARQQPGAADRPVAASLRHPQAEQPDQAVLLAAAGQLWTAGVAIDWAGLHRHGRRRRVPLPTYPFQRKRFWADGGPSAGAARARRSVRSADPADWFYAPAWRESALPATARSGAGSWLILADRRGLGTRLAADLEASGGRAVTVTAGERFARTGKRSFTLRPGSPADFDLLLRELASAGLSPSHAVHLWLLPTADETADEPAGSSPGERLDRVLELGFHSLLAFAQAAGELRRAAPLRLTVVTEGVYALTGDEPVDAMAATVLGPVRVIPAEHPGIRARHVDVVLPAAGGWREDRLVGQLLGELAGGAEEPVAAWRGGRRWIEGFQAVRTPPAEGLPRLRDGGVYLFTGGLGGMALELAGHVAEAARGAKLVLLGRSGLPPRQEWEEALRSSPDAPAGLWRRIERVMALEERGAEVLVLAADVADEASLRGALAEVRQRFGAVHGVVHAAGVAGR